MDYAMNLDPSCKMSGSRMEKYTLRKAFDDPDDPYLPKDVLWRQKEQFSDGVGYGWIDSLKREAESTVTDLMMKFARPQGRGGRQPQHQLHSAGTRLQKGR